LLIVRQLLGLFERRRKEDVSGHTVVGMGNGKVHVNGSMNTKGLVSNDVPYNLSLSPRSAMSMDEDNRTDEWRRLEDALRAHADTPSGATISYGALILLCGRAEAGEGTSYSEGMLMRFGQHRAAGLRQFYDTRFSAPEPDASGQRAYDVQNMIALVQELRAEAGRRSI